MLITKTIEIKISRANIKHYEQFYFNLKLNKHMIIPVEQLTRGSHIIIDASCDICNEKYSIIYKDYFKSHNKHNFDVCNKHKYEKSKITNNIRYGCDAPLQNKNILNKFFETNNERYGGNSSSCNREILNKQRRTRLKLNHEMPLKDVKEFKKYSNRVYHHTRKIKNKVFENWNGYDYYDNTYIKENLNLNNYDKLYPTIDHKISIYYGFTNNISDREIAKEENLVITKRYINCSKGFKNSNDFLI
jgi:hypothetical protein